MRVELKDQSSRLWRHDGRVTSVCPLLDKDQSHSKIGRNVYPVAGDGALQFEGQKVKGEGQRAV